MDYYDLVIGTIPVSFLTIFGSLSLIGVGTTIAIPVAASVAIALIGHALFVRSPLDAVGDDDRKRHPPRGSSGQLN